LSSSVGEWSHGDVSMMMNSHLADS